MTGAKTYKQNSNPVSSPFYLSEQGYCLGAEALSSFRCKNTANEKLPIKMISIKEDHIFKVIVMCLAHKMSLLTVNTFIIFHRDWFSTM